MPPVSISLPSHVAQPSPKTCSVTVTSIPLTSPSNTEPNLCSFCSLIDFSLLRYPTTTDLLSLNDGNPAPQDLSPFKRNPYAKVEPTWSLGLLSRIHKSSSSCDLCHAIRTVLDQQPHVRATLTNMGVKDPLVLGTVALCGRLSAPEGASWLEHDDKYGGLKERDCFFLRRLGLLFRPADKDEDVNVPGMAKKIESWFSVMDSFQTMNTAIPRGFEVGAEDRKGVLMGDEENPETVWFAGRKRPEMIDIGLIKQWLGECLEKHKDICGISEEVDEDDDPDLVEQMRRLSCIVTKYNLYDVDMSALKFASLSYVWGVTPQKLVLLIENEYELQRPNSLVGKVSKTISDAIHLTEQLGLKYLWVDALCIIQNSDDDKVMQLGNIANVYAHSLFTIIAAAGDDSNFGLPGIRTPRDAVQEVVPVIPPSDTNPGMSLITALSPTHQSHEHPTRKAIWASRGWTLQERALSRRAIFIMKNHVLWSCSRSHYSEESCCETDTLGTLAWFGLQESDPILNSSERTWYTEDVPEEQVWYKFQRLVQDYSGRNLKFQGDALDAFSAVVEQVRRMTGENFLWGMPSGRFELCLCWEPYRRGLKRREELSTLEMTSFKRHVPFPSWSWLGWSGAIFLKVQDRELEVGLNPKVVCFVLRNHPLRVFPVRRISVDNDPERANSWAIPNVTDSKYSVTLDDIYDNLPSMTPEVLLDTPDDQLIFFWTESARFKLSELKVQGPSILQENPLQVKEYTKYYREILDDDGQVVGRTHPCDPTAQEIGVDEKGDGKCEFIRIANNYLPFCDPEKLVMQLRRGTGKYNKDVRYRVNVAEIKKEAWKQVYEKRVLVALG
ncbi:heterokaryon incompatibility protein-domain-containing protein [Neurospora tetraspora]|uniref:Heterokaryon incompatibility protein-domain-containing protein n=1 Tax=Neurospora tetraspora TaxID=94610 RepID=A0AAE0J205_9PEZI|nr:heterokaryon incompatibility protein-domain-containing protein [Neurospora tetraspora]